MRYFVKLSIDQRPARTEWVSEKAFLAFVRLGWFRDARAVLVGVALA